MERRPADTSVFGELLGGGLVGAYPVENPLHKDDSHVDVAGDAGQKLRDEVVLGSVAYPIMMRSAVEGPSPATPGT